MATRPRPAPGSRPHGLAPCLSTGGRHGATEFSGTPRPGQKSCLDPVVGHGVNDPHVGLAMLLLHRLAAPSAEHGPARHLLLGDRPGGRCLRPCIAAPRSAPGAPGWGCAQGPCTRGAARPSPASHVGGRPCPAPGPRLSGGAWGSLCSPHPQSPRPGLAERVTGARVALGRHGHGHVCTGGA